MTPRPGRAPGRRGRRWTELDGEAALGPDAGRGRRGGRARLAAPRQPGARRPLGARRPGRRCGSRPLMSILRLDGRPSRGRHVRHPRRHQRRDRARRPDRPRGTERRRQDDAHADRGRPGRAGRGARSRASAGSRSGCSPRRPTSTSGSWPRRTCAPPSATGPSHLERMADELAGLERDGRVTEPHYAELQHRFEVLGGYTLDQRVDAALSGLGFTPEDVVRPPSSLSGGEQTRAALARLVIADPDLLLLDEPTNHLDLGALEWLEEHLRRRARLAPRRVARPGVPRRDRDPRLGAAGPAAHGLPRRLHRLSPPARGARRARGEGRRVRRERQIARERELVQTLPEPPQVLEDARARGAPGAPPVRRSRGAAEGAEAPPARRRARRRRAGALRGDRDPGGRPRRRLPAAARLGRRAGPRRARPVPRRPAGRADRDRGPERRRQDDAPPDDRGRAAAARRVVCASGAASSSATSPSSAPRRSPARRCSTRSSRRSR